MSDLDFLLDGVALVDSLGDPSMRHLTSPISLRNYVRIADETTSQIHGGRLLDWGCGYGQLSYLLRRRGLDITSYDVGRTIEDKRLPITRAIRAVRGDHPYRLPFRSGAFDAVLACGVLEHVDDQRRSLSEIHRVLIPGGQFFVYNLPQRYSYKELLIERLHLGYTHDHRYTSSSIRSVLVASGFRIVRVRRSGLLPHMATGLPSSARQLYYSVTSKLFSIDRALSHLPLLNVVAESLEVVAEKDVCA